MSTALDARIRCPRDTPVERANQVPRTSLRLAVLVLFAAVVALALWSGRTANAQEAFEAGEQVVVSADGDGLNLRAGPTTSALVLIEAVADGTLVTALGEQRQADGYVWERVDVDGVRGWMAAIYLVPVVGDTTEGGDDATDADEVDTTPEEPTLLTVPPPGGFTMGPAGTTDLEAFVDAQSFDVAGIWLFRPPTQDYLSYIPGAPSFVNTLDSSSMDRGSILLVSRRGGEEGEAAEPPTETDGPVTGEGNPFPAPPRDRLTIGVSGTNDPETLAAAQGFHVVAMLVLDIPSQQWLSYIPGAPAIVQTLGRGQLQADSVVWIRAGAGPAVVETVEATLSYYYCNQGSLAASIGDGGGWCGAMANGEIVHEGAAACAREHLGQRFRIVDDPLGLTYTCKDTGSAVHGQHRDVWFDNSDDGYRWIVEVGYTAQVEILADE